MAVRSSSKTGSLPMRLDFNMGVCGLRITPLCHLCCSSHDDRPAPQTGRIMVKELDSTPTNAAVRGNLVSVAAKCTGSALVIAKIDDV